jgi:adenylate kinase family enzyme
VRRIAIIGSGGAGKSVFARELGRRLGLPVIHLDVLFFHPGWVETPHEEWRARQKELVAGGAWIIDGNHAPTMDVRLEAADTVIMLDLPRWQCLWRSVNRSLRYRHRPRIDRAEGCNERLDRVFLRFVWTYPTVGRPDAFAAVERHAPQASFIRLRSAREVRRFLDSVGSGAGR